MSRLVLILSGVLEAVWATALGRSEGFTKPVPTAVFAVALVASMSGLAVAMRGLPVGTAYAIWVGVGAVLTVLTVLVAVVTGAEALTPVEGVCLLLIVAGVVGLKVAHWTGRSTPAGASATLSRLPSAASACRRRCSHPPATDRPWPFRPEEVG